MSEVIREANFCCSTLPKCDQLANCVEKVWGREEWIVNNAKYCGKKLVVNKGFRCSLHYHKIKEETFYVLVGKVLLETEWEGGKRISRIMEPGDIAHIEPLLRHRLTALVNSEVMEFSTHHMDEDSYRVEQSGSIDLATISFS